MRNHSPFRRQMLWTTVPPLTPGSTATPPLLKAGSAYGITEGTRGTFDALVRANAPPMGRTRRSDAFLWRSVSTEAHSVFKVNGVPVPQTSEAPVIGTTEAVLQVVDGTEPMSSRLRLSCGETSSSWPAQAAEEVTSLKARVLSRELRRSIPSFPFCCITSTSGMALLFVDGAVTAGSGGRTRRSRDEGPLPPSRTRRSLIPRRPR